MNTKNHDLVTVDVAKDTLCVLSEGHLSMVANAPRGLDDFVQYLGKLHCPWVFCEATGGYERALVDRLHKTGILVTVINPALLRHFARSEDDMGTCQVRLGRRN